MISPGYSIYIDINISNCKQEYSSIIVPLEFTSKFRLQSFDHSTSVFEFEIFLLLSCSFCQSSSSFLLIHIIDFFRYSQPPKMLRTSSPPTPTVRSQLHLNTNTNACKRGCTYFSHMDEGDPVHFYLHSNKL